VDTKTDAEVEAWEKSAEAYQIKTATEKHYARLQARKLAKVVEMSHQEKGKLLGDRH
jgi:hypothetical protein